jgi:type I restriction enzyme S subunit
MSKKEPKVRLEGFTGEWEEVKLGDVADIVGGSTPSTKVPEYWGGDINWFTPAELTGAVYVNNSERKLTDAGFNAASTHMLPKGTVLFTSRAGIGKTAILECEACTNQGFQSIIPHKDKLDTYFLYSISNQLKQYGEAFGSGTTFDEVSGTQMKQMPIMLPPTLAEQQALGTFFSNLDQEISSHEKTYTALVEAKEGLLSTMFPQGEEKEPKVRFEGFSGEWEEVKLGDLVDRVTRKNEDLQVDLPLTISAQYGLINQRDFFDKRIASDNISGYYVIKNGEFAYNKSTSADAPCGAIKRLDRYNAGVLSTLYIVFKLKEDVKVSSDFLVAYYMSNYWHAGIRQIATEGARNHGLLNVSPKDFFQLTLFIPPTLAEQQSIGIFFSELTTRINLEKALIQKLKDTKSALLQDMFC